MDNKTWRELCNAFTMTESIDLSEGAVDVLQERQRQIEKEGWSDEHDNNHAPGTLTAAAVCYAAEAFWPDSDIQEIWPWDVTWWKPTNRRRNLVKAAALLLAEIDRLDGASDKDEE